MLMMLMIGIVIGIILGLMVKWDKVIEPTHKVETRTRSRYE